MPISDQNQSLPVIAKGLVALGGTVLIALLAIASLVNLVGTSVASVFEAFSSLDAAIVVALITGSVSIFTVVVGAIINNRVSYVQKRNEYLRLHREAPYERLIAIFYDLMAATKKQESIPEEDLIERMYEFNQGLTLWGSSKAIRLWNEWRQSTTEDKPNPTEALLKMEKVLIQLRKDMGQKGDLRDGDILKITLNDYDSAIVNKNSTP